MTNSPRSPVPSPAVPPDLSAQRRQRNALIGLGVGSGVVLLIGIIAAVVTRDPGSTSVPTTFSTVATTVPVPTTTATTSTVVTSTTIPAPVEAVAEAGPDRIVGAGDVVTLTALKVTEGADDDSVMWRQTAGPDVTAGVGALGGSEVSFGAPADVVTLEFELVVTSGDRAATAPEAVDDLVVRVFEDAEALVFVDGERGDDSADGSMDAPFRSIGAAASVAEGRDIYVRSTGTYVEDATIGLGANTSLYGGFDADWKRDRSARALLQGAAVAIVLDGDGDRTVGSIELQAAGAAPGRRSVGIRIVDGETVTVADSRILAGSGGAGIGGAEAGVSVGVIAVQTGELRIERSTVNASDGGSGSDGVVVEPDAAVPGGDGREADGRDAGAGAEGTGRRQGGDGGRGGSTSDGDDAPGGAAGGDALDPDGEPGRGGAGGAGGIGGDGGQGLVDDGDRTPVGASGSVGGSGESGVGGSGGGGGFGPLAVSGGGGGGGGAGGEASAGGPPGTGGAGSIGVWAVDVARVVIDESLVAAGRGGAGGRGGVPADSGGRGGNGGSGAEGANGFIVGDGGRGGGGGGGGAGGDGGHGGGGAGGPSYGMLTVGVGNVEVRASTIRGGAGGNGADGGLGGRSGGAGSGGAARLGGDGGSAGVGDAAVQGGGASGGSSFGWFDVGNARQTFDEAAFIEGNAGAGGAGSSRGDDGTQTAANVEAE